MNPDTNKFEKLDYAKIEKDIQDRLEIKTVNDEERKEHANFLQELVHQAGTGRFKRDALNTLLRPDGTPVPKHWSVFRVGENVVIKEYTFKVAYIGESNILFEPVGPATKLCKELGK
jgi:hypothetical protein